MNVITLSSRTHIYYQPRQTARQYIHRIAYHLSLLIKITASMKAVRVPMLKETIATSKLKLKQARNHRKTQTIDSYATVQMET